MAKTTRQIVERLLHCSGPNWEGDGSKESSACPFHHSEKKTAERYKCSHCSTGQTVDSIYADENGIRPGALGSEPEPAPVKRTRAASKPVEVAVPEPEVVVESVSEVKPEIVEPVPEAEPVEVAAASIAPAKPKRAATHKGRRRRRM